MFAKNQQLEQLLNSIESEKTIKLGLERIHRVYLDLSSKNTMMTGNKPKVITIAGTNGKGSSVSILETILLEFGYKIATFTSPHILYFKERFRINGIEVEENEILSAILEVQKCAYKSQTKLSFFEYATLTSLVLFARYKIDFYILEVGLGGRLDAVNMIDADFALITEIDFDHQQYLGNTLEQIATEKTGIFRPHQIAVYSGSKIINAIEKMAEQTKVQKLLTLGKDYEYLEESGNKQTCLFKFINKKQNLVRNYLLTDIIGKAQPQNLAGCFAILEKIIDINKTNKINVALKKIKPRFRLEHRTIMKHNVLFDIAHNGNSIANLANYCKVQDYKKLRMVINFMADKNSYDIFENIMPLVGEWLLVGLKTNRSNSIDALEMKLYNFSKQQNLTLAPIRKFKTMEELLIFMDKAKPLKSKQPDFVIAGSCYLIGEFFETFTTFLPKIIE